MNLNLKAKEQNTYDAIIVGSGISGGWAAKELTEKGLRTLLLERGPMVEHVKDYPTAMKNPWEFPHRGRLTNQQIKAHPVQTREGSYPFNETNPYFWADDLKNPYIETKRFDWYRGYQIGGKSLTWGRQCYRWSDLDFEANAKEGIAVDWPIRYKDIAPWYDYVEKFAGISGTKEGLDILPDSIFMPPMEMSCIEREVKKHVEAKFAGRKFIIGRVAHLTNPADFQLALGRTACQYRNMCSRGCPYGAYFSTNAATLPAAMKTGKLTVRPDSIVGSIIYDEKKGNATGVRIVDANTKEEKEFYAKIIFVNAATINTAFILLNSKSDRFPNGLGNDSGELGHNLMDHHSRVGASGSLEGFEDKYEYGRRANGIYIPRYRNVGKDKRDYVRGFGYQGNGNRQGWGRGVAEEGFGADFKESLTHPGLWTMNISGFGEHLPDHKNYISLSATEKDPYGLPVITIDCEYRENEKKMRVDMKNDAAEMLEAAGLKNVNTRDNGGVPGQSKHEMGTARMGHDAKSSVLNKHNQVWGCENVFVTDGACMTSSSCVNPSLTYMALTARAVDYAVSELKKQNL